MSDLDRAVAALQVSTTLDQRPQNFLLNIAQIKNFTEGDFLSVLSPAAAVIDVQANRRIPELIKTARDAAALAVVDPVTHFARSPLELRPAGFKKLPYGKLPVLTGFSDAASRTKWCKTVLTSQMNEVPDVVIAPYFFAGEGELSWIAESLECAETTEELMRDRQKAGEPTATVWTSVAIHANWIADEAARDSLLTTLTGQPMEALYLLVHTSQLSFGPLGDLSVLRGFRDLITVLREAGTPVVVGKRASSGLLLLALGAEGWSTGMSGNLMNSAPHPEAEEDGGRPLDRVYVPSLLNLISLNAYVLMRQSHPALVRLDTNQFRALIDQNPDLDNLTTDQRILLVQHNLVAQKAQVDELATRPAGQRISLIRSWVDAAQTNYRALPPTRLPSEGSAFLKAWGDALS